MEAIGVFYFIFITTAYKSELLSMIHDNLNVLVSNKLLVGFMRKHGIHIRTAELVSQTQSL